MTEPRDDVPLERPVYCEHGVLMSEDCAECWADAEWVDEEDGWTEDDDPTAEEE